MPVYPEPSGKCIIVTGPGMTGSVGERVDAVALGATSSERFKRPVATTATKCCAGESRWDGSPRPPSKRETVLFLASDAPACITGATFDVNGVTL